MRSKSSRRTVIEKALDDISRCGRETSLLASLDLAAAEDEGLGGAKQRKSPEARRLTRIFNQFFKTPAPRKAAAAQTILLQASPVPRLKSALKRRGTVAPPGSSPSPAPRVSVAHSPTVHLAGGPRGPLRAGPSFNGSTFFNLSPESKRRLSLRRPHPAPCADSGAAKREADSQKQRKRRTKLLVTKYIKQTRIKDADTFKQHFVLELPGKIRTKLKDAWDEARAKKRQEQALYADPAVQERDLELARRDARDQTRFEKKQPHGAHVGSPKAHKRPQTSVRGTIEDEEMGSIVQFKVRRHCRMHSQQSKPFD